jgi:hypothetical protein
MSAIRGSSQYRRDLESNKKPKFGEAPMPFEIDAILHPTPPPGCGDELMKIVNEYNARDARALEMRSGMSAIRQPLFDLEVHQVLNRKRIRRLIRDFIREKYPKELVEEASRFIWE